MCSIRYAIFNVAACCVIFTSGVKAQSTAVKPQDDPKFIREAAYKIDTLVANWYRKQQLPVPAVSDDSTFLRRAFLVAIGRIPTAEEAKFFLEIDDPQKRYQLIDYLMKSPGYSSHMTNWVFDLIRFVESRDGGSEPYREWIRKSMESNMPWDEFAKKILSSSGDGWDMDSAAVGYYVRDKGMPLDNIANSMRIFLGARMECAQCHDDPFGTTERKDFYHLAAFTEGQKGTGLGMFSGIYRQARDATRSKPKDEDLKFRAEVTGLFRDRVFERRYSNGGNGNIKLPDDYQYKNGKPAEMIAAKTPFGETLRMSDHGQSEGGREKLAEWVVKGTAEQFASMAANRMWKRVMGRPIYDPVDQYIEAKDTNLPEMTAYTAALMKELKYDLRAFQKILMNTKTFQFVPNLKVSKVVSGDDFHGRQLSRLSAEQVWDSLITLAAGDPDKKQRRTMDDRVYVGRRPVMVGKLTMTQLSKDLLAINSEAELKKYYENFIDQVKAEGASASSGGGSMSMMAMGGGDDELPTKYGPNDPVRASELPSPAPKSHLLYLFGQSERQVVEASSTEANVSQVLTLMNGYVQNQLVNNPNAHLYKSLEGASTKEEKVRRIYVAVLNRTPNEEEMKWMLEELNTSEEAGVRNIVSALVMSSEFLFLQ